MKHAVKIHLLFYSEIKNADRCYILSYVNNLLLIIIINKIVSSFLIRIL